MKKKQIKKIAYQEYGKNQATIKVAEGLIAFFLGFVLEWCRMSLEIGKQYTGYCFFGGVCICIIYLIIGHTYKKHNQPKKEQNEIHH